MTCPSGGNDPLGQARALEGVDLLHLLTCETCREMMVDLLVLEGIAPSDGDQPSDGDETQDLYAAARRSEPRPDAAGSRRAVADALFEELTQHEPKRRLILIQALRYRNLDLLDILVEVSHARQVADPVQGDELARLAVRLAEVLGDSEEAIAARTRALCLAANARRLQHDWLGAEALLARAAHGLGFPLEQAFYLWAAGLLRCEEGKLVEGEALLSHAARIYRLEGLTSEASACRALLGLVKYEELGSRALALPLLARGWAGMDRELRPALALRCGLALVDCLASAARADRAELVLHEVGRLYSKVTDAAEMLRVYWYEGRAVARLGNPEEGALVLESVWRKLLAEPSPGEAALVSVDLAVTWAESGRALETETLQRALRSHFPTWPALSTVVGVLLNLEEVLGSGETCPRIAAAPIAANLRRLLRASHIRMKPLPIV